MQRLAEQFGKGDTFTLTPVGVFFGRDGQQEPGATVPDPFFGGAGPERTGCIQCGSCMTGCRYGAKNTLTTNYLGLAERAGAEVHPLTTVTGVRPRRGGGYRVSTVRDRRLVPPRPAGTSPPSRWCSRPAPTTPRSCCTSCAASTLPGISARLGELTRTNSESLLGAVSKDPQADYTRGVAITSSWHPDETPTSNRCRYGKGSNAMGLLTTALTDGGTPGQRLRRVARRWPGATRG